MLENNSFTANGAMDDIIYQNHLQHSCGGYHHSTVPASTTWKNAEGDYATHIHDCRSSSASSKDQVNYQSWCEDGCIPADFVCNLDDCHDLSCEEPPCLQCDEDVVVCTNEACSPPPDQGTCDTVAVGNTLCAGGVPQDVMSGAAVLSVILHQRSADHSFLQQPPFALDSSTHSGCFPDHPDHVHFHSQGHFYDAFGNNNSDTFDSTTGFSSQPFCSFHDQGIGCEAYPHQCYNLAPQQGMPVSLQQRILPQQSAMRSSYSTHPHECASVLVRHPASIEGSSASSTFSPNTQHAYAFSQDSTPSTGTPFPESLQQSSVPYNYTPRPSKVEDPQEEVSESRCLWLTGDQECGLKFENAGDLQSHIQESHTSTLKKCDGFVCQWSGCSRRKEKPETAGFAQRSKLDRHIQSHTGYKACTCDWLEDDGSICGKHFSTQQSLTLHQRTHTGERPHKCEHEGCDYAAAQASQLTMHIRTRHTKIKPLHCPFPGCSATFSESSNLSKHKKIHQTSEQCVCLLCERVFRRPDQLKRHMNTTHKSGAAKVQHRRSISQSAGLLESSLTATWQA